MAHPFFYGADKGFNFHGDGWEARLEADPRCRVVPLPSAAEKMLADHGGPRLTKVGHWLMLRAAPAVNAEIEAWLQPSGLTAASEAAAAAAAARTVARPPGRQASQAPKQPKATTKATTKPAEIVAPQDHEYARQCSDVCGGSG
jgi:hypothetical protein